MLGANERTRRSWPARHDPKLHHPIVCAQEFRIFCRTSSASSLVRSVQSITRFSRKTFSLYAVCARRLSIQSIQYSSYPSSSNRSYPAHKFLHLCEVPRSSASAIPANRARESSNPANFTHSGTSYPSSIARVVLEEAAAARSRHRVSLSTNCTGSQ